jgi:hypothetical protein
LGFLESRKDGPSKQKMNGNDLMQMMMSRWNLIEVEPFNRKQIITLTWNSSFETTQS